MINVFVTGVSVKPLGVEVNMVLGYCSRSKCKKTGGIYTLVTEKAVIIVNNGVCGRKKRADFDKMRRNV
jgi:hypothetical protein